MLSIRAGVAVSTARGIYSALLGGDLKDLHVNIIRSFLFFYRCKGIHYCNGTLIGWGEAADAAGGEYEQPNELCRTHSRINNCDLTSERTGMRNAIGRDKLSA